MTTIPAHLVPSRSFKRAHYDTENIYSILDEALVCTISFVMDNKPFSIPTAFVRYEDKIYIHGSVGSHFIREIEKGLPVCITVSLLDDLVIAKSAFHYSVNYRSVVIFATPEKIEEKEQKSDALKWLVEKITPNSWDSLRPIRDNEIKKTTILAFSLEEASAKIRSGQVINEDEDNHLPIWSGLIPLRNSRLAPVPDETSLQLPLPEYLK
ncbi:pyridoxamine 5'-phosphate oxidase family protein [Chitinophaga solisilvae]|uniref:pyridoxamine 5'-phosphate oxidase family protein n=1 Tax=Chitinophaga solisilvae TaxID=1233460 RepID=UPI00136D0179|nr:pyridoxamine 5'-phosphate oxidase family protein [Chitinophaga solisilvae]